MGVYVGFFCEFNFGLILPGFILTNGKATEKSLFGKQEIKRAFSFDVVRSRYIRYFISKDFHEDKINKS